MPIHLNIPKRHSDPAPCTTSACSRTPTFVRSAPDLRLFGRKSSTTSCPSPSPSPHSVTPKVTPTSSPSRYGRSRHSQKYRRLSHNGTPPGPTVGYFSTTPRRATHPHTSPRRFRRGSYWMEDEMDPWVTFRQKGQHSSVSPAANLDEKLFFANADIDPNTASEMGCYRLRSFSITSKGIISHGDFLRARSHSDASVTSEESSSGVEPDFRDRLSSVESTTSTSCFCYRVLLLGAEEVGKSSLLAQFMTSECLTATLETTQTSIDGGQERTVSLLVDGEESELICEDPADSTFEVDDSLYYSTDAFLVIFSVTDRKTLDYATRIINHIRDLGSRCHYLYPDVGPKVVILVANKVDLVRCRTVTTEDGRSLADRYDIKYIETSVGFSHNVDELLVGVVTQIRLKAQQALQHNSGKNIIARSMKLTSKARDLMDRLLQKCDLKARSCDNLHVI